MFKELIDLKVKKITARFEGSGDSGGLEDLYVEPEGVAVSEGLKRQLSSWFSDKQETLTGGGWFNDEGGSVVMKLALPSRRLSYELYAYETKTILAKKGSEYCLNEGE